MGKHKKGNVVRAYKTLLQADEDWDYAFLLELEQKKLKRMADYFSHSEIAEKDGQVANELLLCVHLLDIVLEKERFIDAWTDEVYEHHIMHKQKNTENDTYSITFEYKGLIPNFPKYVNIRNGFRFKSLANYPKGGDSQQEQKYWAELYKEDLRRAKAWHLYNLVREYKMFGWWN